MFNETSETEIVYQQYVNLKKRKKIPNNSD